LFGETLADLVSSGESEPYVIASLRTGGARLSCRIWLGSAIAERSAGSIFAVSSPTGWVVTSHGAAVEGEAFNIVRLQASPAADNVRTVAVLDDDPTVTDSIVSSFKLLGYRASPFYRAADLLATTNKFDGFVLDWIVGEATVLQLVQSLRSADASCPIVILTAQVASGLVDETDIAEAMKRYDLLFCEKPVRASIIAAMLSRAFPSQQDRV